ncbi:MAG: N-acetyl-gamma-glutamyl-phosphate reductase [Candidatus Eiseniibacteriota bacterium]
MNAPLPTESATTTAAATGVPATAPAAGGTRTARAVVLGASGYSGSEFVRLALGHPGVEIVAIVSRDAEGRTASDVLAGIDPRAGHLPPVVDVAGLVSRLEDGACDTVIACLPHGGWRGLLAESAALASAVEGARTIDLSSDHRDGSAGYVYGLPEAFRTEIRDASRIANPGCYATAAALALLPAAEQGWLGGDVVVSALSGASGAGRAATLRTSFVELDGGAAFYKVGTEHAHVPEMERTLARTAGKGTRAPRVAFAPQLVPMARGILLTAQAPLARPVTQEEARRAYEARYADEPFVRVLRAGEGPETRNVRGSNRVDVQVMTLFDGTVLLATAALDNLGKGAAGQSIQNLNLMLGWPETTALPRHGSPV